MKAQLRSSLKAQVQISTTCSFYNTLGITRRVTSPLAVSTLFFFGGWGGVSVRLIWPDLTFFSRLIHS